MLLPNFRAAEHRSSSGVEGKVKIARTLRRASEQNSTGPQPEGNPKQYRRAKNSMRELRGDKAHTEVTRKEKKRKEKGGAKKKS